MRLARIIVTLGIAVLAFEAIAAAAAGEMGLRYDRFAFGSYAIFAAAGLFAGRGGPLWWGPIAGGAVAAVSGIFGWRLAALVGPVAVRLGLNETHAGTSWLDRLGVLALVGAALGLAGAGYAHWRERRVKRAPE